MPQAVLLIVVLGAFASGLVTLDTGKPALRGHPEVLKQGVAVYKVNQ